jgi:alanyl-tRNA synthetase
MDHNEAVKTERLYYTDSYLREFDARVLEANSDAQGFRVYLDRTAFYPDSGGQPADRGILGGIEVLDVVDEGGAVAHLLARKPEQENVRGIIDWPRRFDHMQQHTGQHLLSAAFEKAGEYKTVSFHLGAESSTIDLDSERVGTRQIEHAEELASQVAFEDRPVSISFRAAAEAGQMDLRKPTQREGEVRLVQIEDFDLSACGRTHVSRTGAVGLILVRRIERTRGQTRVEFVCGGRALRSARRDFRALREAAQLLSGGLEDVPSLITKQSDALRTALRAGEKLTRHWAQYRARELWVTAPERKGRRIVRHIFGSEENLEAKMVAHAIAALPASVALLGVKGTPASVYFAQSAGGPSDVGAILRQTLAGCGGKGGGSRDFAQGGGLEQSKLEQVLARLENLIED